MTQSIADSPSPVTPAQPDGRSSGYQKDRCTRCRQPRSFHRGHGRCLAFGCRCPGWQEPEDISAAPPRIRTRTASTARQRSIPDPSLGTPLTPTRHLIEPHNSLRFGPESYGASGCCSFFRFCRYRAVFDSFDALGRRRALCRRHLARSSVFGERSS